ncbi:MAG: S1C family serine protease [Phycisphaerae bacterium]
MSRRAILRQFLLNFAVTLAVIVVVIKADLVSYVAYSVQRGRLQAVRENLPSAEDIAQASMPARDVAHTVLPAVVFIEAEMSAEGLLGGRSLDDILNRMGDATDDEEEMEQRRRFLRDHLEERSSGVSLGSGFIVDADQGFVLTNHHVIENAKVIDVYLADGRRVQARVIGQDEATDLAVVQIEADRLHEVTFGDSNMVETGDEVFTLGSPFGLTGTVSRGIISGKGRSNVNVGGVIYKGFLQTDAVINPGNSGGPLVNLRGQVIGVNTAIATQNGVYNGVGFAIPSTRVTDVLPKLLKGEKIIRGFLGVRPANISDYRERASALGWDKDYGALVLEVVSDSGAEAAGILKDDILVRLDGMRLQRAYSLIESVGRLMPGAQVTLDVFRDGRELTLKAALTTRPD